MSKKQTPATPATITLTEDTRDDGAIWRGHLRQWFMSRTEDEREAAAALSALMCSNDEVLSDFAYDIAGELWAELEADVVQAKTGADASFAAALVAAGRAGK